LQFIYSSRLKPILTFSPGRLFDVIPKRRMDPCLSFPKWRLCFGRFSIF